MRLVKRFLRVITMSQKQSRYLRKGTRETEYSPEYRQWKGALLAKRLDVAEHWDKKWRERYHKHMPKKDQIIRGNYRFS